MSRIAVTPRRPSPGRTWIAAIALGMAAALAAPAGGAAAASQSEQLVEESRVSLERMIGHRDMANFRAYLARARGVLIIPELVKGGFILGAEGGTGVFLVRGSDGTWSPPAFYTLGAGSIGLQAGAQISEVVFTLMSDGAIEAFLRNEFKLGGDVSVALGPIGAGLEASTTTNLNADVFAFSRAVGLFGGGALEGAKIFAREKLNAAYYGSPAPVRDIVVHRKFFNPQADALRKTLPQ